MCMSIGYNRYKANNYPQTGLLCIYSKGLAWWTLLMELYILLQVQGMLIWHRFCKENNEDTCRLYPGRNVKPTVSKIMERNDDKHDFSLRGWHHDGMYISLRYLAYILSSSCLQNLQNSSAIKNNSITLSSVSTAIIVYNTLYWVL